TAQDLDQFVVDDLDDLLGGVQCLGDLLPQGALAHTAGELADDGDRDVGVEQRAADLTDGLVDIRLGEAAMAAQPLERGCDAIGEVVEHEALPLGRMDRTSLVRRARRPQDARSAPQERTATLPQGGPSADGRGPVCWRSWARLPAVVGRSADGGGPACGPQPSSRASTKPWGSKGVRSSMPSPRPTIFTGTPSS